MSAPVFRKCLPILQAFSLNVAGQYASRIPRCAAVLDVHVRHKKKMTKRFKAPHVAQEKDPWIRKATKIIVKPEVKRSAEFLSRVPTDNVWIHSHFPEPAFTLQEAIKRHQEAADPGIFNHPDNLVYADMKLDMSTKKKTKFLSKVYGMVRLPHYFDDGSPETRCIVFARTLEEQELAIELGAIYAGAEDLVSEIKKGSIELSEFEYALCVPDMITELVPIRVMLRSIFPHQKKGSLHEDIEFMMDMHMKGIAIGSQPITEQVSKLQVPLGKLSMPVGELLANYEKYVEEIGTQQPPNVANTFITDTVIVCPPSNEMFRLKVTDTVVADKDEDLSDSDIEEGDELAANV